ncbi:hypothetical protein M406DRAFT_57997 [Cryphonectria parasitica EP155]|uniref:Uncharacterized protein n=1 Tax=Cryphonectria parasitica (strain ATCC 38755 / EP155) TaxID=660469 RepID=A0A9P4XV78_CRYP1|nr:uncharacterized protein M406DRAFT_57997 [Cryphonectria parasitica EP155]KAF3761889.1 hypothetical protein M406DRAFT_57997 [Cryphonectria parasitica EP155]
MVLSKQMPRFVLQAKGLFISSTSRRFVSVQASSDEVAPEELVWWVSNYVCGACIKILSFHQTILYV